jgi:hypothetical protein
MTPPAKAGGFFRSSLPQQRLLCLRTGYCPTLATQGPIQALDGKTVGMSSTDTQQLLRASGFRRHNPQVILLSKDGLAPVEATPPAIEAGWQEEPYDLTVENKYPSGLRSCSIPLSAKADSPLEQF